MCICAGSAGRPAEDFVLPFPITWPPSLHTYVALHVHVCTPAQVIPQSSCRCVLRRPSTCLPSPDWFRLRWLRNPDWRPKNHTQRVWTTLCLSVVHVQLETGWSECTYVYELKVLVFSHESERQEILAGQLCVSTNMNALIKNRVGKILKVGQRVLHMQLNVSVNNSRNSRPACCSTCVKGALQPLVCWEWKLLRDLCCFKPCCTGESNLTTFMHKVVKRQLVVVTVNLYLFLKVLFNSYVIIDFFYYFMPHFEHFSYILIRLFCCFKFLLIYLIIYLFIHHSSASALIHLSTFAPTCQPPGCVQRQEKCQPEGEEIKAKPECGRRPAGDWGAAKQPRFQGVSRVNRSSNAMRKCLISRPHRSTAAFVMFVSTASRLQWTRTQSTQTESSTAT